MTDSENESPKERSEEISVTEVSDRVLQELSGLFSNRESVTVIEPDASVESSDETPTEFIDLTDSVFEFDDYLEM
jgi:hypothetical protein